MPYTERNLKKVCDDIENGQPISVTDYVGYLVDTFSNDFELGSQVRELINQLRKPSK